MKIFFKSSLHAPVHHMVMHRFKTLSGSDLRTMHLCILDMHWFKDALGFQYFSSCTGLRYLGICFAPVQLQHAPVQHTPT
ncbi:hypothetical protein L195_g006512 [Trifolium pratense]|uniref:Uncharacterized protein n=1 Tax=Trifolium pratense TaxID=57577 RepID=A0A2K3P3V1_TRIPR|nr:hypothetical protein L195_g006512 [Trifolium pratense]